MNDDVKKYIDKQLISQKEILEKIHTLTKTNHPAWNENVFGGCITYEADNENKFGKVYLVALKDHINFGVAVKGLSDNILEKLDKVGKVTGSIEIRSLDDINKKEIIKILKGIK